MLCRFKSAPFALISPLWSRVRLSLSGTERETPLKMEISLYKCQFPLQKGYFYSVFGVSPVSAVSQNNELKILPKLKRHIWGGIFWSLTVALILGLSQLPYYIPVIVLKLYKHDFIKNTPTN